MHFIFDFDGTLVDSFHMVIEKFNLLADEVGFRKVDEQAINSLKDLTSREFIQYLEIPMYKIPGIILEVRKHLRSEIRTLPTFQGMPEVLHALNNQGISLGILTSNAMENVSVWLQHHHLQHLFSFIYAESSFLGKKIVLRKIMKSYHINKAQAFYIGDETRDIEAAKGCGAQAVAVTWGFNSEKILSQHQPHYMARKPEDILAIG